MISRTHCSYDIQNSKGQRWAVLLDRFCVIARTNLAITEKRSGNTAGLPGQKRDKILLNSHKTNAWNFFPVFSWFLQHVPYNYVINFCSLSSHLLFASIGFSRCSCADNWPCVVYPYLFIFQSCWPTKDHIGRATGISNPAWHLPQVVPRVDQTIDSVHPQPTQPNC